MGGSIRYQGKTAEYHAHIINREIKWDFVFEDVGDLEALLRLGKTDAVYVDRERMNFPRFKDEMLSRAHRIYTSRMSYVQDITNTPEFQAAIERVKERRVRR